MTEANVGDPASYFLPPGYVSRLEPKYLKDFTSEFTGVVHQPDVYALARELGRRFKSRRIIDLGCGRADKLRHLADEFEIIGVDFGSNIEFCRQNLPQGRWIDWTLESAGLLPLNDADVEGSLVVCSDVIEHLVDPTGLLANIRRLMDRAAVGLLSTPERDRLYGPGNLGPPGNPHHLREWTRLELEQLCIGAGIRVGLSGLTLNNDSDRTKTTTLLVLENSRSVAWEKAPASFRVAVFLNADPDDPLSANYARGLIEQGMEVIVCKDATSSRTELDRQVLSSGGAVDWVVQASVGRQWMSPWNQGVLRDALWRIEREGFDVVESSLLRLDGNGALLSATRLPDRSAWRIRPRDAAQLSVYPYRFPYFFDSESAKQLPIDLQWARAEYLCEWLSGATHGAGKKATSALRNSLSPLMNGSRDANASVVEDEIVAFISKHVSQASHVLELGPTSESLQARVMQTIKPVRHVELTPLEYSPTLEHGTFDLLLALDSLHRLADPWERLAELAIYLKPGGLVVLSLPNAQNIRLLLKLIEGEWDYLHGPLDPSQLRMFTLRSMQDLVVGAGLEIVDTSATLIPPIDPASLRPSDNFFQFGKTTLSGLSADEVVRLFAYRYHLLARRPG